MHRSLTGQNKIGVGLALFLGLSDVAGLAQLGQTYDESTQGPPVGIIVASALLGVVTVVAAVAAWRTGSRRALRTAAATRILSMIGSLPAFFVDGVPAPLVALAGAGVVVTVVNVALLVHRPDAALDQPSPQPDAS